MINIEFEKELGKNYMVIKGGGQASDYSIRMVRENEVEGLLPVDISNIDGDIKYFYEIDGYQQMEKYYSMSSMEYKDIENVIAQIVLLPEKLEEYLLDKDKIFLSTSTVFINSEGEVKFVYYPDDTNSYSQGIKDICTYILRKLNHQDEKAVSAGYAAFEICSRENFALSDFEKVFNIKAKEEITCEKTDDKEDIFFKDEPDEIDFVGLDLFEEEDFEDDYDDEDEEETLPPFKEKESKKDILISKLIKFGPFALIAIVGLFLFLSSSMATLSLPLRIVSFLMISVAIYLISYLLKGKISK